MPIGQVIFNLCYNKNLVAHLYIYQLATNIAWHILLFFLTTKVQNLRLKPEVCF